MQALAAQTFFFSLYGVLSILYLQPDPIMLFIPTALQYIRTGSIEHARSHLSSCLSMHFLYLASSLAFFSSSDVQPVRAKAISALQNIFLNIIGIFYVVVGGVIVHKSIFFVGASLIPKLCKTVFHLVQKLNFVLSRAFTRSVDYNCFLPAYNLVQ